MVYQFSLIQRKIAEASWKFFNYCGQTGIISSVNTEGISYYNLKYIVTVAPKSWYDMLGARRGKQMTSVKK